VAMKVRSRFSGLSGFARIALLGLAAGAAAAGCGRGGPEKLATTGLAAGHPKSTAPVRPPAPPAPPAIPVVSEGALMVGDTMAVGSAGGTVVVSAVEADVSAGRLFSAPAGKEYYAVHVKACSGPTEQGLSFSPRFFTLHLVDGTAYDADLGVKKPDLVAGEVPAGGCRAGWITYVVPQKAQGASVIYEGSRRLKWGIPPPRSGKATGSGR